MATLNDAGLLLMATEQGMGIGLTRELLAADALLEGRLVRVAPRQPVLHEPQHYHVVYSPGMKGNPALTAFVDWLHAETAQSRVALDAAMDCLSGLNAG